MASFFVIIWTVWKERNARIFKNSSCPLPQLQDLVLLRLSWWIKGWGDPFPYSSEKIIRNPTCLSWNDQHHGVGKVQGFAQPLSWLPPPRNQQKWNVDASVNTARESSAIGDVLRDHLGNFKCMFSSPIPPIEINCAEILAIYRAIQISINNDNIKKHSIIIESDSVNAVKWCNDDVGGPWNLNFQLNFIRNARKRWLNLEINHRGRGANMVADSLAKQGLVRNTEFLAWL